jgi:hypothetical protein
VLPADTVTFCWKAAEMSAALTLPLFFSVPLESKVYQGEHVLLDVLLSASFAT